MKINGKKVKTYKNKKENINGVFAYDGCHKIYICETKKDCIDALANGYRIIEISLLEETYNLSCELKFINNWKLTKTYVPQCEDAYFEYEDEPTKYFEYVAKNHILSMSFEGELNHVLNAYVQGWSKLESEFQAIFEKHGVYYEMGNSWNLTCYPC